MHTEAALNVQSEGFSQSLIFKLQVLMKGWKDVPHTLYVSLQVTQSYFENKDCDCAEILL